MKSTCPPTPEYSRVPIESAATCPVKSTCNATRHSSTSAAARAQHGSLSPRTSMALLMAVILDC